MRITALPSNKLCVKLQAFAKQKILNLNHQDILCKAELVVDNHLVLV